MPKKPSKSTNTRGGSLTDTQMTTTRVYGKRAFLHAIGAALLGAGSIVVGSKKSHAADHKDTNNVEVALDPKNPAHSDTDTRSGDAKDSDAPGDSTDVSRTADRKDTNNVEVALDPKNPDHFDTDTRKGDAKDSDVSTTADRR